MLLYRPYYPLLIIALLCFVPLSARADKAARTILVMGDSLSAAHNIDIQAGWVSLLSRRLKAGDKAIEPGSWQTVNASISGETTRGGRTRLSALLKKHQPELCIIELGANDGLRGQSIRQMQANLGNMIEQCLPYGRVLLLGIWLPPNYGPQYTRAFRAVYPDLARRYTVPLVPFFLEGVADKPDYMQADGLHPNASGQALILDNIWPTLQPLLLDAPGKPVAH